MHHPLPLPATKIKCILALANEDGMRGGTLQGQVAKGEHRRDDLVLLLHGLNPTALPVCLLDLPSPDVSLRTQEHMVVEEEGRSMT